MLDIKCYGVFGEDNYNTYKNYNRVKPYYNFIIIVMLAGE